jgi:hypothetical protein
MSVDGLGYSKWFEDLGSGGVPVTITAPIPLPIVPSQKDRDAFVGGVTPGIPVFGVFDDTLPVLLAGQMAAPRLTNNRAVYVNLRQGGFEIAAGGLHELATFPMTKFLFSGTINTNGQSAISYDSDALDGAANGTCLINLTGVWSGVLSVQDITGSFVLQAVNLTTGEVGTDLTKNGNYLINFAGRTSIRLVSTTWNSGTVNITARVAGPVGAVALMAPLPPGLNTIGSIQGIGTASINAPEAATVLDQLSLLRKQIAKLSTEQTQQKVLTAVTRPLPARPASVISQRGIN